MENTKSPEETKKLKLPEIPRWVTIMIAPNIFIEDGRLKVAISFSDYVDEADLKAIELMTPLIKQVAKQLQEIVQDRKKKIDLIRVLRALYINKIKYIRQVAIQMEGQSEEWKRMAIEALNVWFGGLKIENETKENETKHQEEEESVEQLAKRINSLILEIAELEKELYKILAEKIIFGEEVVCEDPYGEKCVGAFCVGNIDIAQLLRNVKLLKKKDDLIREVKETKPKMAKEVEIAVRKLEVLVEALKKHVGLDLPKLAEEILKEEEEDEEENMATEVELDWFECRRQGVC